MSRTTRLLIAPAFALLLGVATGCGDDGSPADVLGTDAGVGDGADEVEIPSAGGPVSGDAVDVCALFTEADFTEIFGASAAGEAQTATGSFLGGCDYMTEDVSAAASLSARPVGEFEQTIAAFEATEVGGAPFEALFDETVGMFVRFDGEPWFLQILAYGGSGATPGLWNQDLSLAVAAAVDANR